MFNVGRSTFAPRALTPALSRRERGKRARSLAARPGFTLVEMLVVIFVILAVTVLAIGVAAPNLEPRRLREAARQVEAFLQGAKSMAAQTGRPVAVLFERDPAQPLLCRTLKYAEIPPPYAGDTVTSQVTVTSKFFPGPNAPQQARVQLPAVDTGWLNNSDATLDLIHALDFIRFNFQGPGYQIRSLTRGTGELTIEAVSTNGLIPLPENVPMSYQISRQPVPSAGADLELPETVVLDFSKPVVVVSNTDVRSIVFMPGGTVAGATSPLYVMVGKRELVETGGNTADFETFWVAVNPQSGLVITAPNAGGSNPLELAQKALSVGGR